MKEDKGIIEITGDFTIHQMSPGFYKLLTGEYPEVSTIEQADIYGKTPRDLEKEK